MVNRRCDDEAVGRISTDGSRQASRAGSDRGSDLEYRYLRETDSGFQPRFRRLIEHDPATFRECGDFPHRNRTNSNSRLTIKSLTGST